MGIRTKSLSFHILFTFFILFLSKLLLTDKATDQPITQRETVTHDGQVGVVRGFAQPQFLLLIDSHSLQHTVEDVVVSLIVGL